MIKNLCSLAAVLLLALAVKAQVPANIFTEGTPGATQLRFGPNCSNDAGTISIFNSAGQIITEEVIYLAFGDSIRIVHNGDQNLSGDPVSATPPGIVYPYYLCKPNASGMTLTDIDNDTCLEKADTLIFANGAATLVRQDTFWIAGGGEINGNAVFKNVGQTINPQAPVDVAQYWFAPTTIDNFDRKRYEADPAVPNAPGGQCINIRTDQAFSVVSLNPITISDIQQNIGSKGCLNSFVIDGGLPEASSTARYQVEIVNTANEDIMAEIVSPSITMGDTVEFRIPEDGTYEIRVSDTAGSSTTETVTITNCEAVVFNLPFQNVGEGTQLCVPVTVENFNDVGFLELNIGWDMTVVEFAEVRNIESGIPGFNLPSNFNASTGSDRLSFSWITNTQTDTSLVDGSTLFEICFNVVGSLGDQSPLEFLIGQADIVGSFEIDDQNNAVYSANFMNGQVNVSDDVLFIATEVQNITCNSINSGSAGDGTITLTIAEGIAPYNITYRNTTTNGQLSTESRLEGEPLALTGLEPGDYQFTITDAATPPNDTIFTLSITQPMGFLLSTDVQADITCNEGSDGSMTVRVLDENNIEIPNPEASYTFLWSNGETTRTIENLSAGPYRVTVTDSNGCTAEDSNTLSGRSAISLNLDAETPATCSGQADGGVVISASGGTPNGTDQYTFRWADGVVETDVSSSTRVNIAPGFYTVTMEDANGCTQVDSVEVTAQKALTINDAPTDILCFGDTTGVLTVSGSSSTGVDATPYAFNVNGPTPISGNRIDVDAVTDTYTDLTAGIYNVTMRDADGCEVSRAIEIAQPDTLLYFADSLKVDESCDPGMDGSVKLFIAGGTPDYSYEWRDTSGATIATVDSIINQRSGRYFVDITDANGCILTDSFTIFAPAGPQITQFNDFTLQCNGDMNGQLSVSAQPTNAPIRSYVWSNGANGTDIVNLQAGIYQVTITSEDECTTVAAAEVIEPAPIMIDSITRISPTCPGGSNGRITLNVTGGTGTYVYIWDEAPLDDTTFTPIKPGLPAGSYEVTIANAADFSCSSGPFTITLSDPPALQLTFADTAGVSCPDDRDGVARVIPLYENDSTGTFVYEWLDENGFSFDSDSIANQLRAGFNTVIVRDANSCAATDSVFISSPPEIETMLTPTSVSCFGETDGAVTVVASGGSGGFSYDWSTGATVDNISGQLAGTYSVIVTDINGCTKADSAIVTEPAQLMLSIDFTATRDPRCADTNDGVVAVMVNTEEAINPLGPQPYIWGSGVGAPDSPRADSLSAGTYEVTVVDSRGCRDSTTYTLVQPDPLVAVISDPEDPRCFGEATFLTIESVTGGNGSDPMDYTYQIDRNGLNFPIDQPGTIFAGDHIVEVFDPLGCSFLDSVSINQPEKVDVSFTPAEIVVELGDTLTQLQPIIISSLPVDSFIWEPAVDLSSASIENPIVQPSQSREYALTIIDDNGCSATGTVFVELDRNRNVFIPNAFSPNGDGRNDEFRVFGCKGVTQLNSVQLFDRWGDMVYQATNIAPDCAGGTVLWDGELNGNDAPQGVYVYVVEVEFLDGIVLTYRGSTAIVR